MCIPIYIYTYIIYDMYVTFVKISTPIPEKACMHMNIYVYMYGYKHRYEKNIMYDFSRDLYSDSRKVMHTYVYIHICMYTFIPIYMYIYIYDMYVTFPEISTPILEKVCIHMNIYIYICLYTNINVYVHKCI